MNEPVADPASGDRPPGLEASSGRRGRRWLVAILCLLVGASAGWAAMVVLPRSYASTASVLVMPVTPAMDTGSGVEQEVQIDTEAEIARSSQVASLGSQLADGQVTPEQLMAGASVTVPTNSQVLDIAFRADAPALAQVGASSLAEAYLQQRSEQATQRTDRVVTSLQAQLTGLRTQLDQLNDSDAAQADQGTVQRADADAQRSLLLDQISDINSRLVPLLTSSGSGGSIITAAAEPQSPAFPQPFLALVAGTAVGLLAALGVLLSGAPQRSQVGRQPADAILAPGQPAAVPVSRRAPGHRARTSAGRMDREQPEQLLARLGAAGRTSGPVVVVGLAAPEASFAVAEDVAASVARSAPRPVALVVTHPDLDPRGGEVRGPGLSDLLRGDVSPSTVSGRQTRSGGGTVVVTSGTSPTSAVGPDALSQVWRALESEFAAVVVLIPSPLHDQLARAVVRSAGRLVVVTDADSDAEGTADLVIDELEWFGLRARLVGVVVAPRVTEEVGS